MHKAKSILDRRQNVELKKMPQYYLKPLNRFESRVYKFNISVVWAFNDHLRQCNNSMCFITQKKKKNTLQFF